MAEDFGFIPDEEPKDTLGFIPDEIGDDPSGFIPDRTEEPDDFGFVQDKELIPEPAELKFQPFIGTGATPPAVGFDVFTREPKAILDDFLKARAILAIPSEKSKEGLKMLSDLIPDPETKSTLLNVALGTPKTVAEIGAEFASAFIHPDTIALVGGLRGVSLVAKTPGGKQAISEVVKAIPEKIRRGFTYRFGQPQVYKDAAEQTAINMRVGNEVVGSIGKNIESFTKVEQRLISKYLRGEAADITPEMKAAANAARAEFTRLGRDAVDLGMLDAGTYQANINTYLPRMYRNKELAARTPQLGTNKPLRANLDRFKKRQDIPEEIREGMGEILEAGYPTTKGLLQLNQAVEKAKMFRKVATNTEITAVNEADAIQRKFTQLPQNKALGELSGRFVEPEVANDLNQMIATKSEMTKLWRKTLGTWKFGKVVLSPSTHMRNIFTNSFWLDVSGVNHIKQAEAIPRMIKQIRTNGPFYQLAKKEGLVGTELVGADIKPFQEAMAGRQATTAIEMLQKGSDAAKRLANKAGKVYQAEEQVFKMIKFEDNLAKGMATREAALEAETWIFNYNKVPPFVDAIRNSPLGVPFITYISKAIPQLAKAATANPLRVYKYSLLFDSMENVAKEQLGITEAQMQAVRERGVRLVPFKRKDKRGQSLDVDFLMPWGELAAAGKGPLFDFLPQPFTPSGPVFALNNALIANYDPFRKREIWNETDTTSEKIAKTTDYLGKALLPNLTPGISGVKSPFRGGFHFQELVDAFRGEPRFPKRESKSIPEALLSTGLGLKTGPFDIQREFGNFLKRKGGQRKEVLKEAKRLFKHEGVTAKEKEQIAKEIQPKIEKIFKIKPDIEMLKKGIKVERKIGVSDPDQRAFLDFLAQEKAMKEASKDTSLKGTLLEGRK